MSAETIYFITAVCIWLWATCLVVVGTILGYELWNSSTSQAPTDLVRMFPSQAESDRHRDMIRRLAKRR